MAKTDAERQAAYRARHVQSGDSDGERINMVRAVSAKTSKRQTSAGVSCDVLRSNAAGDPGAAS
jgi:hypothetical protein